MRQFAQMAGISNPYLSQIERGLRAPSEQVLEAIATTLKVSVDALYEQAGVSPPSAAPDPSAVVDAIRADPLLTARQRAALVEIYHAFVAESPRAAKAPDGEGAGAAPEGGEGANPSGADLTDPPA